MKRYTWKMLLGLLLAVSLILSVPLVYAQDAAAEAEDASSDVSWFTVTELGTVDIHTELQQEALAAGADHFSEYSNLGVDDFSQPAGVEISWSYAGEPQPDKFTVSLSLDESMADAQTTDVSGANSCILQNLLLGTTYYYTITAGDVVSDVYSFTTAEQGPRNLSVEGITNVRDLGGWETNDGGRIRQGLLYRCGQLNTEETTDPCITEAGIEAMKALGVKTEIDFRRTEDNEQGGITESPLGSDVNYYSEPIGYVTDISPDAASIQETFRIMADAENYPLFYHCKIGTDRTGLISYLVLALCGVPMDEIYVDYAFSNLGQIQGKRNPNRLDKMIADNLADYAGETPADTARNYLTAIGVTEEELDAVVSILVEK